MSGRESILSLVMQHLSRRQKRILSALAEGWTLKSHRYVNGVKVYRLHSLEGAIRQVGRRPVERLCRRRYIHSNQKFPAATYLLTGKGRSEIGRLRRDKIAPLGSQNFLP